VIPSPAFTVSHGSEEKISPGLVEGINTKIWVIQQRAYGLREEDYLRLKMLICRLPEIRKRHSPPTRLRDESANQVITESARCVCYFVHVNPVCPRGEAA
jgi:hypothetical protein